jgi:hypothetical protein
MSGKSSSNKSIISDSNSSPATLTPDLLSELKKFVQPPTETASIKLFAIFLDKYSTQSPRDCSFALDEFIQKSPENMQLYIDTVYNTIPSSTEQNRAMKILKKQVIPTLFHAIEFGGNDTSTSSNIVNTEKSNEKKDTGVVGANGVMYYGGTTILTDVSADPEVAHRLICALLRAPSTWIKSKKFTPMTNNQKTPSVISNISNICSSVNTKPTEEEPSSELRMKLLLEYSRCTCKSFSTPAQGSMLANAYGAIIGSLQGTDQLSPEVAVVVACLNMLCDRLYDVNTNTEKNAKNAKNEEDDYDTKDEQLQPLRTATIQTGLEVLTIALELVPGTALIALWDMIASLVFSVADDDQKDKLMHSLTSNVNKMENSSRRALIVRKLLKMNMPHVKSKL